MGSKERRERERQATRANILAAVRAIAGSQGWPAVTVRRIAEHIEYTAPVVYEHFENKEAVLTELLRQGFEDLAARLEKASRSTEEPTERVLAVAEAYCAFSRRESEVYALMHGMGGVPLEPAELTRGAQQVCDVALDVVQRWAQASRTKLADPLEATELLWSALHGLACLSYSGRLGGKELEARARSAVLDLLAGWRSRSRAG
ncbi:MAG: TetR/AcrR family transcriptional regulator [Myxococcaceae bacterium]|nr:TetR/AcrR family transcriptional regulator [Myxococcaceae bacterium]MCI0669137.1 TetR/AcrR family transcriptional regulator [Myxococcaceae bacterium]